MPTYPHFCHKCAHDWDVVTTIAERNDPAPCPKCRTVGERQLTVAGINGAADWNTQSFNPGLGCYTKNTRDARRIAKSRGYQEVGNEPVESIHKAYDKQRADAKQKRWADDREKLYGD